MCGGRCARGRSTKNVADHELVDGFFEQLREARHVHALARRVEVDRNSRSRRGRASRPPCCIWTAFCTPVTPRARESPGDLRDGGLHVVCPSSHPLVSAPPGERSSPTMMTNADSPSSSRSLAGTVLAAGGRLRQLRGRSSSSPSERPPPRLRGDDRRRVRPDRRARRPAPARGEDRVRQVRARPGRARLARARAGGRGGWKKAG